MKVPDIFVPEKNIDNATESLKHTRKRNIKNLKELILDEDAGFPEFVYHEELGLDGLYYHLRKSEISNKVFVDYGEPCVSIIEFEDQDLLTENIGVIRSIIKDFNDNKNWPHKVYALLKERYAIFIYADLKDSIRARLIDAYKRIGFKEPRGT